VRPEALTALALRAQAGDQEAKAAVLSVLHPLLTRLSNRYGGTGTPSEDLYQEGALGILQAIQAFNPERRAQFLTFAYKQAQGAILHALRDRGSLVRVAAWVQERYSGSDPEGTPLALRQVLSLDDPYVSECGERLSEPADTRIPIPRLVVLRSELGRLPPAERAVCSLSAEGYTMAEAGRRLGCSEQQAWRLRKRARIRLQEVLR
jgi:RNA polymerase sigma factor (sigma-70 family)